MPLIGHEDKNTKKGYNEELHSSHKKVIPTVLHRTPLTQSSAHAHLASASIFFSSDNSIRAFSSASENLGVSATLS